MRIAARYSHLNGYEFLVAHKFHLWKKIEKIVSDVDAEKCRTKQSREKRIAGRMLYSPKDLNKELKSGFEQAGWQESRTSYWVTGDVKLIRKTMNMDAPKQKKALEDEGEKPLISYNQTDFVKDRVAVEVQFGKYAFVAYDLFVKHMAFFTGDMIDLGIEILPMKELQAEMSSGIGYYEGELYNLVRQGRTVPAVPLIVTGIAP